MDPDELLTLVEAHLVSVFGQDSGRASISFLGTDRIDVLRFGPDAEGLVRYATLGMSRHPMSGSSELTTEGPRAELVLSVQGLHDTVLRRLGALAASPAVEGVVLTAGAGLDLGESLWDGSRFTAVLVGQPGGLVPDVEDVSFLPLLPMTPNEAAWKRVHGAAALQERWLGNGTDLRDPQRKSVSLD